MSYPPRSTGLISIFKNISRHRLLVITALVMLGVAGAAISRSLAFKARFGPLAAPSFASEQESRSKISSKDSVALLRFAGLRGAAAPSSPRSMLAPTVTATKTDALFADVDGDLQADPGDTLKYTVTINASGENATGVNFTDTVDPNTAFVPGSLTATPVAVDDSYSALGNVRISVPAPGVTGNDFAGVPAATITGAPSSFSSTNGGDVALNADGSFTYNPPAGFEGTDTFTYTLMNGTGSNSATVAITVSGMIWFINNAAGPGDGRLTTPFNSLASFQAVNNGAGNNPAANDNIFVYESATNYVGSVTLLNGQRFIGQDATASLSSITGLTPPTFSDPLPVTNSANATIVNITSAGTAITVGSGNTLIGFTGGDAVTDIGGIGFGTLTISDVTLNGIGQALDLTTGTLAATFGSISSTNSATTGISLTSVAGSLTTPTTTITDPAGIGISVGTSSATLSFGDTTANASGSAGVVLGGSGTGNTGTISFGALNIAPDAGIAGLVATDNTNTITTTSGTINSGTATAVDINRTGGTTPLNMTFTSLSSSGGTATGVMIQNTTGSFTVVGDGVNTTVGGNSSGGTIANKTGVDGSTTTGIGIYLNNATNITLRRMTINGTNQNYGIRGTSITGFVLEYSTVNGANGDNVAADEGSIIFDGLFGTSTFTNDVVGGSVEDNFRIRNSSGTGDVTITGSTLSNAPNDNLIIEPSGTSTVTAHVTNNTFTGAGGDHLQTSTTNSATLTIVFTGNFYSNGFPGSLLGGVTISGGNGGSTETVNFNISNNGSAGNPLVGNVQGGAININQGSGGGTWQGQVSNNFIGNAGVANSGSVQSSGIRVENHSPTGTMTAIVSGNTVSQWNNGAGINFQVGDIGNVNAAIDLTVTNNNVNNPGAASQHGVQGNFGANAAGTNAVCFDFRTNTVDLGATPPNGGSDLRLRQRNGSTVRLPGYGGAPGDATAVQNFEIGQNTLTAATPATQASIGVAFPGSGGGFVGGAACSAPVVPLLLSNAPEESVTINHSDALQSAVSESVDTLRAAPGEARDGDDGQKLRQAEIVSAVAAAIERWRDAGISAEDLMRLQSVTFEIADLPDGQLATANWTSIKVDETAAGYGWYVDSTPMEDSEFDVAVPGREIQTTEYSLAHGRGVDLLTVVMRQLGAVYLHGNSRIPKQLRPLMQNTLSPAIRRLPGSSRIQLRRSPAGASDTKESGRGRVSRASKAGALRPKTGASSSPVSFRNAGFNPIAKTASRHNSRLLNHASRNRTTAATFNSMLADVMLSIGTLPAGESVTITFNVTVDNPFTGASPQVSNQGTVSGSNFADVLTDDPDVGGTADPTVTPIDLPQVTVAVSPTSVLEDGVTNLTYTFTRTGSTAAAMTVNFNVTGSTASAASDYTVSGSGVTFNSGLGTGTVIIPVGSTTATVTVDPSADITVEPDETVIVNVASGTGYVTGTPASATGTIINDDTDVTLAVSPSSVSEDGAGNLVYTFTRVGVTSNSLTVNFSIDVGGNNAVFPADYAQSGAATYLPPAGTVTFGAGASTATVTVDPTPDLLVEPDETVILTLTSGTGYNVGTPNVATGTITNDDAEVSVTVSPSSVSEDGPTNLVYTFTRTGFTLLPVTVNFSVGGTAVFSQPDYTQTGAATYTDSSGTVLFGAGDSIATVTINPASDSTVELDETVILTVTSGTGYNVGSPSSATGTITNDDADVSVAVSPASVAEDGATNLVYTFTRSNLSGGALTVNFSVGGTAVFGPSPDDYTQTGATTYTTTSGSVTFASASPTATVTVNPEADNSVESDETVDIALAPGAGYTVGSPSAASGTITNDDADVSVAVSPSSVAEDGATNLVYTFTRSNLSGGALTVNFSVGGSASFPGDYSESGATTFAPPTGTVTFGASSLTATVTVNPTADTIVESDETVDIALTAGAGYTIVNPSAASGTITNDDADVSVAVSPGSVAEDGATNLVYTFTRTGFTGSALTVNFSVGGTAVFSQPDYTQAGAATYSDTSGTVTFGMGNNTAMVTIDPVTDTTIEPDESVILTLTLGIGYNVVEPSSATGTITNDDADVSVAVAPASVAEDGATNLVYTFTRSNLSGGALTVNFSVGGTATFGASPNDYTQTGATTFTPPTGTVTFAPGNLTVTVTVDPETDTTAEPDETVVITLAPGGSYNAVSPSSATGTILNDDTLVSVVVAPSSTAEGGANLVYTFTRTGPTTNALTVNFSVGTGPGTASFPADYTQSGAATFAPPNATVTFGAGSSTATVTVTPLTDCTVEGNETVDFTVQSGTGYGVGSPSSASGTITNTPDSTAPTITLIPNVNMTLWPPNHQYEDIAVTDFVASASDNCDPTVDINDVYITKITSDEVEDGNGDGNTLNDIVIGASCKTAQLRSERANNGDGRVYSITFKVKDSEGNFATATTTVTVRKSPNQPAVDSGTQYTVNSLCP